MIRENGAGYWVASCDLCGLIVKSGTRRGTVSTALRRHRETAHPSGGAA